MNARAPDLQTRRAMRQHGRALLKSPHDVSAHLARLHAALRLLDAEPVQGILADLFVALPQTETVMRQAALQMAGERLPAHVADSFRRHSEAGSLPTITPLATRWSLIARPSADVSARVRRVNPDHSRSLAMEVAEALRIGRTAEAIRIEAAFLDHCENCQDKLAFMLAARELRRHRVAMDERWTRTSTLLEQRDMMGHLQPSPDSTSADTK